VGEHFFRFDAAHAHWNDNKTEARGRESDVVIGTDDIGAVEADFRKKFETVDYWFHDISIGRSEPRALSHLHPNSHLGDHYWGTHFMFIHCCKPKK
jgi:hypothetical protein